MKKLLFGLFATVLFVLILPVGATAATHQLGASFAFANPPDCHQVGHVDVQRAPGGWSLDLMDQTNQFVNAQTGLCYFPCCWGAGYFERQTLAPGAFRINPGLSHADLNVTIPAFHLSGDHDIGQNTLLPLHFTWNATGPRVRHPDGTVTRAATVNGTIMTCGDSADYCERGGCSAAPPCTRTDLHVVATFVGVKGVLQGS